MVRNLLWLAIVLLVIGWLMGVLGVGGADFGGIIHFLVVLAVIIFLIQMFTGKRPV